MSPLNMPGAGGAESAARILGNTYDMAARALERIATGQRINRAADDPAGLAVSEKLRAEVRGFTRQAMNALDQASMIQVADAGAAEVHSALQNIAELSVQAGNSIYTADERAMIQAEIDANLEHIDTVAKNTQFNSKQLLAGELGFDMGSGALGLGGLVVTSPEAAGSAISTAREAISQVSEMRGSLGAMQNNLESQIRSLEVAAENTLAAESRIRDADIAEESVNLTQAMVRAEMGIAALAHANLQAKAVSKLLEL